MAKQKQTDFVDDPAIQADVPGIPASDLAGLTLEDVQQIRERMRILEQERDEARQQAQQAMLAASRIQTAGGVSSYWKVELQGALTHVVKAVDPANAWEQYKREMGVLGSEHPPRVSPSDREAYHQAQARRRNLKPEEYPLPDDE